MPRVESRCQPCYGVAMLQDLITAFAVAFAAVTGSALITRIWVYF
jgi:hypothetical protein